MTFDDIERIVVSCTSGTLIAASRAPSVAHPPEGMLRLHSNECPFELPQKVVDEVMSVQTDTSRYPDEDCLLFRETAAQVFGCHADQIVAGNGCVDLLSLVHRTFLSKGDSAIMCAPGFSFNRKLATLQGARLIEIPWGDGYSLPFEEINKSIEPSCKFILVTNPNNPTGTYVPVQAIEKLVNEVDRLVVVDEAYVDFAPESALPLIARYPNILVLRSFSKAYSSAGIRLGLAFGHAKIAGILRVVQNPYALSAIGQAYGVALLRNRDLFKPRLEEVIRLRQLVIEELTSLGFKVLPSEANFVFAGVPDGTSGHAWKDAFRQEGILVMHLPQEGLPGFLRIGITNRHEMSRFLEKVKRIRTAFL